jgi:hypothetical protein
MTGPRCRAAPARRVAPLAGRPRPAPTARDLAALRFVGEQYAVRVDVAGLLLARLSAAGPQAGGQLSRRQVREQLSRWERAGWAKRRRLLGHTWVLPTRAGLRLAGLAFDPWTPALDRLEHHHAVAVVRLAREPIPGAGGWVCERELWRRRPAGPQVLPDRRQRHRPRPGRARPGLLPDALR